MFTIQDHLTAVPKGTAVFLPNTLTREAKIDYYINENDYQYHWRREDVFIKKRNWLIYCFTRADHRGARGSQLLTI